MSGFSRVCFAAKYRTFWSFSCVLLFNMFQDDPLTNQLDESLNLFGQIVNNSFFLDSTVILFLNKFDLFRKKILYSGHHLRFYFTDYEGMISTRFFGNSSSLVRFIPFLFMKRTLNQCWPVSRLDTSI